MKNIVLYKSKYGHTLQYAQWLADDLGFELRDFSNFKKSEIKNYNIIIFGSGVYMSRLHMIKKVLQWFKTKPIIIFACAGNNYVESEINHIKEHNFTEEELHFHHFFYLPGGVDFTCVKGFHKLAINAFIKLMKNKANKTPDEQAIIDSYFNPTNYVDKKNINEIVRFINQL